MSRRSYVRHIMEQEPDKRVEQRGKGNGRHVVARILVQYGGNYCLITTNVCPQHS